MVPAASAPGKQAQLSFWMHLSLQVLERHVSRGLRFLIDAKYVVDCKSVQLFLVLGMWVVISKIFTCCSWNSTFISSYWSHAWGVKQGVLLAEVSIGTFLVRFQMVYVFGLYTRHYFLIIHKYNIKPYILMAIILEYIAKSLKIRMSIIIYTYFQIYLFILLKQTGYMYVIFISGSFSQFIFVYTLHLLLLP